MASALALAFFMVSLGSALARDSLLSKRITSINHAHRSTGLRRAYVTVDEISGSGLAATFGVAQDVSSLATASFSPWTEHPGGFAQLRITTNASYPDTVQMLAAGFVEGYLTAEAIADHWHNWQSWIGRQTKDKGNREAVVRWLLQHHTWLAAQLLLHSTSNDPYWMALRLVMSQFTGLMTGYAARQKELNSTDVPPLAFEEWVLYQGMGELMDLAKVLNPTDEFLNPDPRKLSPEEYNLRSELNSHCTSVVRVTDDLSDIFISQSANLDATSMTRIYKHYNLQLNHKDIQCRNMSFSGYAALLFSFDDFWILDSGLVVTETTIAVKNLTAYDVLTPRTVLSWQRVRVANMLAKDGPSWGALVERYNSGTYNNQYLIINLKKFRPKVQLDPWLLTIAEQIPGRVLVADATQDLVRGYFASYNAPYFQQNLYDLGWVHDYALTGASMSSFQQAPRAKIFRRDIHTVKDLEGLKRLIRTNVWQDDPFSENSPVFQIAARGDLIPGNATLYAQLDSKVTSYYLALNLTAYAVNGPSNQNQTAWTWKNFPDYPHKGLPETYEFEWELQAP